MFRRSIPLLSSASKTMKYYAVKNGRQTGIFYNWPDCARQVKGYSHCQYRLFKNKADAISYLNDSSENSDQSQEYYSDESEDYYSDDNEEYDSDDNGGYYSDDSDSDYDQTPVVEVYTDGASKNNQGARYGASSAGYGVFYGPNDSRNFSGRVSGEQTNNRGELQAINHALYNAVQDVRRGLVNHYRIITDSQYAIDCITKWVFKWQRNGWMSNSGRPVLNRDLIESCRNHLATIQSHNGSVEFCKIGGHSGIYGNEMADQLAVEGCYR